MPDLLLDDFLQLERRAAEAPHTAALLGPGREPLTYLALWNHVGTARGALLEAGVSSGEAVALVMRQGPEWVTAFLAIASRSGCAPLDPALTESEYGSALSRLGARTLIVEADFAAPAAAAARELGMRVVRVRPALDRLAGAFTLEVDPGAPLPRDGRATDAAVLVLTSATAGHPKLVPLTPANLHARAVHDVRALGLTASDRFLSLMPMFHIHGLTAALTQLSCGGSVACVPGFEVGEFISWLNEFRPTWFTAGPPLLRVVLRLVRDHPALLRGNSLRLIRSTGAVSAPGLLAELEDALQAFVLDGYGTTETGGITRSAPDARKPGSVGRSSGCRIAILEESGRALPPGIEGEIAVQGPSVTSGYLDDPDANRAAFRDDWFRTGDLGRLDEEGFLYLTGRVKEMINRGGEKIRPTEVDEVLATHPAVADAAAFAIPHRTLGEDVGAAVVVRPGASVSEDDLRKFAATRLALFKVPRRIVFVDRIPRGPTGKPRRTELSDQHRDFAGDRVALKAPLTAVETRLIEIWSRILGTAPIGVNDDFFRLGGDSLTVALMLTEVQKELNIGGVLFDRVEFFDQPRVASLARIIVEGGAQPAPEPSSAARVVTLQAAGVRTPFFCVLASDLGPYHLRQVSKCLGNEQPVYAVRPPQPVQGNRLGKMEDLARLSVAAIRSLQPRGPYALGGHCYGGVVAFEAARQLLLEGEEITRLILFDVPTPGYPKVLRHWRRYLAESRRVLAGLGQGEFPADLRQVLRHPASLARNWKRRFRGRACRALSSLGAPGVVAERPGNELMSMVLWEYAPQEFLAPIVHFIAADEPVSTKILDDPRLGWREFARGGLEIRMVRGDHNSIFAGDHAPELAAQLEPFLRTTTESQARIRASSA